VLNARRGWNPVHKMKLNKILMEEYFFFSSSGIYFFKWSNFFFSINTFVFPLYIPDILNANISWDCSDALFLKIKTQKFNR
jgi:hypothetical protein